MAALLKSVLWEGFSDQILKKSLNSYIRAKPQLLEKVSWKIGLKKVNIFLHNSIKISGNFNIKHLWWSKTDLSKEMF